MTSASGSLHFSEASRVMLSKLLPVLETSDTVGALSVLSSVKLRLALSLLPALSVSDTSTV